MFIVSKIILKSALLAAGAATPFIAAAPTGNGSTQPPLPAIAVPVQLSPGANAADAASSTTVIMPGRSDRKIIVPPGLTKQEQLDLQKLLHPPSSQRSMTNIPKSYEIYLLYRSDGTLMGPNGVVPLKPSLPKNILVEPGKKP